MKVKPVDTSTNFGILTHWHPTRYGYYMTGVYKGKKIDVYNAYKVDQKLIYVSDAKFLTWIKSKLIFFQDGIKKITRADNKRCGKQS